MSTIPNPYDPLQPAADPAQFYGREEVFAFFRQHFVGGEHDQALVLFGRRGLGKSSLLYLLPTQIDERYAVCLAELGAVDVRDDAAVLAVLADGIHMALEQVGASTYRLPDWPTSDEEESDLRAWFQDSYLDVALAALRGRFLVLALDDAQGLIETEAQTGWLAYFHTMLAATSRLEMVLSLEPTYENRALAVPLLSNPSLHVRLAELSLPAAERLVREPTAGIVEVEDELVEQVLAWVGGHPFLLHAVGRLLFRRSEERSHQGSLTLNDLEAIAPAAVEQAGEILRPLWISAPANQRIALAALVNLDRAGPGEAVAYDTIYEWIGGAGFAMNKTQLAAALRSLEYDGLIRLESDGRYTLAAGLIADWLLENKPALEDDGAAAGEAALGAETSLLSLGPARLVPVIGLLAVILLVGLLGAAALGGVFDDEEDEPRGGGPAGPTATLSLNLEATRQSDYATQTQRALPTRTPTSTGTPTPTPTATATATASVTPTASRTPRATHTARPSKTPTERPSKTPTEVPPSDTPTTTLTPSRTPRPTRTATLDPGG